MKSVAWEMERSSKIILKILLLLFQNHLRITALTAHFNLQQLPFLKISNNGSQRIYRSSPPCDRPCDLRRPLARLPGLRRRALVTRPQRRHRRLLPSSFFFFIWL